MLTRGHRKAIYIRAGRGRDGNIIVLGILDHDTQGEVVVVETKVGGSVFGDKLSQRLRMVGCT